MLPPCDVVIKAVADYVRNIQDIIDLEAIAKDIFKHSQVMKSTAGFGSVLNHGQSLLSPAEMMDVMQIVLITYFFLLE